MRVLSYNILIGGRHRVDPLKKIIAACNPDVVGLIEATDEHVVEKLARLLGMDYRLSGHASDEEGAQGACLSRLPIIYSKTHSNALITKQPLLEVGIAGHDGQPLTIFVTHLTADFSKFFLANRQRKREVHAILHIMKQKEGTRHLLMGDFNSIAPGEPLQGSAFLQYVTDPELYYQLKPDPSIQAPDLDFVLPAPLRIIKPLLEQVPRNKILRTTLDSYSFLYAPRGGFDLLKKAGYVDCFRATNTGKPGFTWPAPIPAGRVDYIFASSELVPLLSSSAVLTAEDGLSVQKGSDHLPLYADFSI